MKKMMNINNRNSNSNKITYNGFAVAIVCNCCTARSYVNCFLPHIDEHNKSKFSSFEKFKPFDILIV